MANVKGGSNTPAIPGVLGENTAAGGLGVSGTCEAGHGIHGESRSGIGVYGYSETWQGVSGKSIGNAGVVGESTNLHGVYGTSHNPHGAGVYGTNDQVGGFGVQGINEAGDGVIGTGRRGVVGISDTYQGVSGWSRDNAGVVGESVDFDGVYGVSHNPRAAAISGHNHGGRAAYFDGDVDVTGDIRLNNADCAEDFNIGNNVTVEPGMVMVLGEEDALFPCRGAYDKCVAGVVSGAGDYRPAIVLDKQKSDRNRQPIALLGKVYCKVDAQYGAIEVGDMLTTSPVLGHAMKVSDPLKAFGAVIGKALRPLKEGTGLIPILIALQ